MTEPCLKKTFPKSFISTLLKFLLQEPPSATTFFERLSSSAQPEIVSLPLSLLTPGSIIFVALLRCLVLFRSCFCWWQGSKIKAFPGLRAETGCASGVVVSYSLRVLWGETMDRWCCPNAGPQAWDFGKQGIMAALLSLDSIQPGEATVTKGSKDTLDYSRDTGEVR